MFTDEKINAFIINVTGKSYQVSELQGDASHRKYYRIISGEESHILCIDEKFKGIPPEEYGFCIVHQLFMKNGIPVPEIYSTDNNAGLMLIQDLGDTLLENIYSNMSRNEAAALYGDLINIIAQIQFITGDKRNIPFSLAFDTDKLMFEFSFFVDHALNDYFRSCISSDMIEELRIEFSKVSGILYRPELFVLNHRDFHSRNVMINKDRHYLIDFQDARMGLPHYDLVSLVRDSYLRLDDDLVEKLKNDHFNILKAGGYNRMTYEEYEYYFDIMAFQRNVKAIGTFGYQVCTLKKNLYQKYIQPTVDYLNEYAGRREVLSGAYNILKRLFEA